MRAATDKSRWFNLDSAGAFLGLDSRTVRRLVTAKKLAGMQPRRGAFLISRQACENFLATMGESPTREPGGTT